MLAPDYSSTHWAELNSAQKVNKPFAMLICYGHVDMQPVNMLRLVNDFICPSALGISNKYPHVLML